MTVWLEKSVVLALHEEQLAEHGGRSGLRDEGLLDAALAHPINKAQYGNSDVFDLAAAYAFGLSRDHPFADGNKRVSLVATELFLELNGQSLEASDVDCLTQWLSPSSGALGENDLADWLRRNCRPLD